MNINTFVSVLSNLINFSIVDKETGELIFTGDCYAFDVYCIDHCNFLNMFVNDVFIENNTMHIYVAIEE